MEITLEHVSKTIKQAQILTDISLQLCAPRIVGQRGVNGSGKTMLMRLLCGLVYPTQGQVRIDGQLLGKDRSFPASVGALIERPAFLDDYSGRRNLQVLTSIQGRAGLARIDQTIRQVGLDPDDPKPFRKYSLGMKQRLGIAGAIVEQPDLILVDEPTNALDTDGIQMVKELLHQERARGALIVLACHDQSILEDLSDEVFHIVDGRIQAHYLVQH